MSKTIKFVVYLNDCLFWSHSKSEIDNVNKSFKVDWSNYNLEHSQENLVSEYLGIGIKTFYYVGSQFYQTGFILKVLEANRIEHCNWFPTPTTHQGLGNYWDRLEWF